MEMGRKGGYGGLLKVETGTRMTRMGRMSGMGRTGRPDGDGRCCRSGGEGGWMEGNA